MGYKNLNKAPASRVISMAEESIAKPKRPHARTSRPCQLHTARGCPTTEKRVWRRASPEIIEGVVATPTFNASHQTSWLHLCREDPWTVLSWSSQLTRGWRRHLMGQALKWCTKGLTNGRPGSPKGSYIMWETLQRARDTKFVEKNTIALRTATIIKSKKDILENCPPRQCLRKNLCTSHLSSHCFSLFSYPL